MARGDNMENGDNSAATLGSVPALPGLRRRSRRDPILSDAQQCHTHLDIDGQATLSELPVSSPDDCNSLSIALPASVLRDHYYLLKEVIARSCLLFLSAERDDDLPSGARWNEVSCRRLLLVSSPWGVICYIDSIPCFAYRGGGAQSHTIYSLKAFARAFLDEFLRGIDLSSSIALACESASGDQSREAYAATPGTNAADSSAAAHKLIKMNSSPHLFRGAANDYLRRIATCTRVVDASAIYVIRDGFVLMTQKLPKKSLVPGVWYLPGGKLNNGESPEACASRELFEETGLQGVDCELLGVTLFPDPREPARLFRFYQYVLHDSAGIATPQDDIISCEWVPVSEVARSQVFELTWAGLFVGRLTGMF
jgi:8-oxo-dGTP diphosphatase